METMNKGFKRPTKPRKRYDSGVYDVGVRCVNCGLPIEDQHETTDHIKGLCSFCSDELNRSQSL